MNTPTGIRNPYIFHVVVALLYPNILFWREHNRNAAAFHFCVISIIAPCIEYIKVRVENFDLYFLIM